MAWDGLLTKGWVVTAGELGLTVPPEAAIVGAVPGKPAEAQVRERWTREREREREERGVAVVGCVRCCIFIFSARATSFCVAAQVWRAYTGHWLREAVRMNVMARESLCALQHFDLHRRHFSLLFSVFFMNDLPAGGAGGDGGGGEGGGGSDEKKEDKGKDAKKDAKKEEKKDAAPAEGAGGGGGTLASYMDLLGPRKMLVASLVAASLCGNVEMVLRSKFSLTGGVAIANSIVQEVRASGTLRPPLLFFSHHTRTVVLLSFPAMPFT